MAVKDIMHIQSFPFFKAHSRTLYVFMACHGTHCVASSGTETKGRGHVAPQPTHLCRRATQERSGSTPSHLYFAKIDHTDSTDPGTASSSNNSHTLTDIMPYTQGHQLQRPRGRQSPSGLPRCKARSGSLCIHATIRKISLGGQPQEQAAHTSSLVCKTWGRRRAVNTTFPLTTDFFFGTSRMYEKYRLLSSAFCMLFFYQVFPPAQRSRYCCSAVVGP